MTGPTSRQEFMGIVRGALGRRGPVAVPAPPVVDETLVRLASWGDDLVAMFAERAAQVGMEVRRTTAAGLATQLLDVLRVIEAKSVTVEIDRLEQRDALVAALAKVGIEVKPWEHDRSMANHYTADAGITDVHLALAETGTLVCCSGAEHGRGHSLVPAVHIAIVRRCDIVPDLLDLVRAPRGENPSDLPSGVALITGPSKTADIEGILITGVHGPGRVFVVIVEDA